MGMMLLLSIPSKGHLMPSRLIVSSNLRLQYATILSRTPVVGEIHWNPQFVAAWHSILGLVGGLAHGFYDFPFSWEWNNHPNWRTHIFQRGGSTTNQGITSIVSLSNSCHLIPGCGLILIGLDQWLMNTSDLCQSARIIIHMYVHKQIWCMMPLFPINIYIKS